MTDYKSGQHIANGDRDIIIPVQEKMQRAGSRWRDARHTGKYAGLHRRENAKMQGEEYHENYPAYFLGLCSIVPGIAGTVKYNYRHL